MNKATPVQQLLQMWDLSYSYAPPLLRFSGGSFINPTTLTCSFSSFHLFICFHGFIFYPSFNLFSSQTVSFLNIKNDCCCLHHYMTWVVRSIFGGIFLINLEFYMDLKQFGKELIRFILFMDFIWISLDKYFFLSFSDILESIYLMSQSNFIC